MISTSIVVLLLMHHSVGERIIMISPIATRSHENIFNSVAKVLVADGHDVTMALPGISRVETVKYLNLSSITQALTSTFLKTSFRKVFNGTSAREILAMMTKDFSEMDYFVAEKCLENEEILSLYKLPPKSYDLVIISTFISLCALPLAHVQQVPLVLLSPSGLFHLTYSSLGNPDLPSISPSIFLDLTDDMTFTERFINTVLQVVSSVLPDFLTFPRFSQLFRNRTGLDVPSVRDLMKEASLVMSNTHHAVSYPRALLPNIQEIGGIHCTSASQLPEDWEDFITKDGRGFIFFSLGSSMPGHILPNDKRDFMLSVFARLPYQVVWKYDKPELMKNIPDNVKVSRWCPQQDLLGHPKIRLFITQGGMLSIQEATYHGVPILGLPLFGDQFANVRQVHNKGYGLILEWDKVNEMSFLSAIQRITGDSRFGEEARKKSEIFRDGLTTPQEKVSFWIKYMLRHNGANFLKSPGRQLAFYQYYLLDVLLFVFAVIWLLYKIIMELIWVICCRKRRSVVILENAKKKQ